MTDTKSAAEKLAEGAGETGDPAETTAGGAESAADGSNGTPEGEGTGDGKPEGEGKPDEKDGEGEKDGDAGKPEQLLNAAGKPFTKADLDGLNTALRAARKDAKDRAAELAAIKAAGGDRDPAQIVTEAQAAAEQTWKPRLVKLAARSALTAAGLALPEGREDAAMGRALRLVDVEALTVTEDGDVEGLAEQIEGLRGDFPELFAARRVTRPRIDAADRGQPSPPARSSAELLLQQLHGR